MVHILYRDYRDAENREAPRRAPTQCSLDLVDKGINIQQISIYSFLGTHSGLEKDHWSWNQKP